MYLRKQESSYTSQATPQAIYSCSSRNTVYPLPHVAVEEPFIEPILSPEILMPSQQEDALVRLHDYALVFFHLDCMNHVIYHADIYRATISYNHLQSCEPLNRTLCAPVPLFFLSSHRCRNMSC